MIDLHELESKLKSDITPQPTKDKPHPRCPVKFNVKKGTGYRLAVYETDNLVTLRVNIKKVKGLDDIYPECLDALMWAGR